MIYDIPQFIHVVIFMTCRSLFMWHVWCRRAGAVYAQLHAALAERVTTPGENFFTLIHQNFVTGAAPAEALAAVQSAGQAAHAWKELPDSDIILPALLSALFGDRDALSHQLPRVAKLASDPVAALHILLCAACTRGQVRVSATSSSRYR